MKLTNRHFYERKTTVNQFWILDFRLRRERSVGRF